MSKIIFDHILYNKSCVIHIAVAPSGCFLIFIILIFTFFFAFCQLVQYIYFKIINMVALNETLLSKFQMFKKDHSGKNFTNKKFFFF